MRYLKLIVLLTLLTPVCAWAIPEVPIPGTVTMVDIGSTTCVPCKMMDPVLKALREKYKGRVEIIFSNINESKRDAKKFGIRAIPTQIFFDSNGKEIWRHSGFLDQKSCEQRIDQILAQP